MGRNNGYHVYTHPGNPDKLKTSKSTGHLYYDCYEQLTDTIHGVGAYANNGVLLLKYLL